MSDHKKSILILEDNPHLLKRFSQIVNQWDQGQVIACCTTLKEALEVIQSESIDLLMADINLPDGSGIQAIRALNQHNSAAHAIVISVLTDVSIVVEAIQAGAVGYILKDDDSMSIIQALETVLMGESPISASIARQIVLNLQAPNPSPHPQKKPPTENRLTERETEILTILARGYSNKEVAEMLHISTQTVPVHIRNIYKKLQTSSRAETIYEAQVRGLIQL